ncbi:MAG TPA: polysaccharide deacetylase family protein [Candidatus Saccharimonadales bacterium]|nr:polysaccharide deacetylase family protein [Candidatus Saccharimonadales bacterium]
MIRQSQKNQSLASILMFVSGFVLTGICLFLFFRAAPVPTLKRNVVSAQVSRSDTIVKNYDITYPVFHVEKVDMILRNYATHQVDDFLHKLGIKKDDPGSNITIKYTILHYGTRTTTVVFHSREQVVNQPVVESQKMMTFDLVAQTQLDFSAIFNDKKAAEALLARILHDYFQHDTPGVLSSPELVHLLTFELAGSRNYTLDDDRLIVYINPHQLTSTEGIVPIAIKKELLVNVLKEPFQRVDTSLVQSVVEPPVYAIETMPHHEVIIDPKGKLLALSFDDGPGSLTPKVLDVLKKYDSRATFFVIGRQVLPFATTVQRTVAEGNEIGNHSWNHPKLTVLSYDHLQQQIQDTQHAIESVAGGYTPVLMRPPEGVYNGAVVSYLNAHGLTMQLWSIDTLDWLNRDSRVVYDRIMAGAADGRVILLHDIHPTSVEAVVRAIPELVSQGYQLVTVSQLHQYR